VCGFNGVPENEGKNEIRQPKQNKRNIQRDNEKVLEKQGISPPEISTS